MPTNGVRGVHWNNQKNKWQARIRINYKYTSLGFFNDIELAAKVRKEAEIENGSICGIITMQNGGYDVWGT